MATIGEVLNVAVQAHQAGDLAQAERLYRQVLASQPQSADAWHLLGLVAHARHDQAAALECITRAIRVDGRQSAYHNHLAEVYRALGQLPAAEASARQALRLQPDFAIAHNTLGGILAAQQKYAEAAESYRRAIALLPTFSHAYFNLGAALHALNQRAEAVIAYRQAIESDPASALAHNNLAALLAEMGQVDDAIAAYRRALQLDPRLALAENNLGALLQLQKRYDEALACYRRALAIDPRYAGAHCNLGGALMEQGQYAEARQALQQALALDPRLSQAHFNLGVVLQQQGQAEAAIRSYEQAIAARPSHVQAYNNLGSLYRLQGRFDEAIGCFQHVLELQPDSPEALNNLGNVFKTQGRIDEALICYDQTLRVKPDYDQARYNRSLLDLAAGRFAEGWPDYEYRSACPEFARRTFDQPRWRGEPLRGRTLLVYAEQGLGDTLQFIRYLPLLAPLGANLIAEVQPALVPLLEQSGIAACCRLVPKGQPLPAFDLQVPLLSLPGLFGTTLETMPRQVPYLAAAPELVAQWRQRLASLPGLKVGIAWQGSKSYVGDRYRSIPLRHFAPLAQPGVSLVSLQKGHGAEQLDALAGNFGVHVLDGLDEAAGPFMDTAAAMMNLDLVVTSDTAIAHLAGALGVTTWVALPLVPDWRWMQGRADSPWYPTMRLFRQTAFDDWTNVMAEIGAELTALKRG